MKYHQIPSRSLAFSLLLLTLCLALPALASDRGEGALDTSQPQGITVEEIIQRFAAKEKQFKIAREQYAYRQSLTVQTLDGDTVNGEFKEVEDVLFDDKGNRIEHVVFAPQSSLVGITMTKEDFDDIRKRMPFVLTTDEIPEYQILYVGKQRIDEIGTDVEDVGADFVDALLADVENLVLRNLIRSQHERHAFADVVKVLFGHGDADQAGLRREHHMLDAVALVVEQHVFHFLELAVHRVAVQCLHRERLPVGVVFPRQLEFLLLGRKLLDDLLLRNALGRRAVQFALAPLGCRDGNEIDNEEAEGQKIQKRF